MTKKAKKSVMSIIKDIYYRITSLPLLFLFWLLIIFWRRRVEKRRGRLIHNRLMLEEIYLMSFKLKPKKRNHQQKKVGKFEKELRYLEKTVNKDEEMFLKKEEQLRYYLKKLFDPNIGLDK